MGLVGEKRILPLWDVPIWSGHDAPPPHSPAPMRVRVGAARGEWKGIPSSLASVVFPALGRPKSQSTAFMVQHSGR